MRLMIFRHRIGTNLRSDSGLTLLEAVLGLAIVGGALVALLQSFAHIAHVHRSVTHHTQAIYILHQKVHDLRFVNRRTPSLEGTISAGSAVYRWEAEQRQAGAQDLHRVQCRVGWDQRGKPHQFSIMTWIKNHAG